MMPPLEGKAYFPPAFRNRQPNGIVLFSSLILAGLVSLTPQAGARQCGSASDTGVDSLHVDACVLHRDATTCSSPGSTDCGPISSAPLPNAPTQDPANAPPGKKLRAAAKPDFNRAIFYENKLEFALDVGWLPINVPFPFDFIEGDPYELYPLRYTLVPVNASLRWHFGPIKGPVILRGNWDATFTLSATAIPRGAETHYFSYDMGVRRNFVPRNWRVTPYWDVRAGLGLIDAKGPLGVYYAQGQNFTFALNMGAGARYNFSPRYAFSAGLNWMHLSNGNLSAPAYSNYGINVYGPFFGLDVQLRRHRHDSGQ
jgi:hypothetical protein